MFLDRKKGGPCWGKGSGAQAEVSRLRGIYKMVGSLVTQLVKNPPAIQETLVQSLGWEDPLEKG